MKLLFDMNLSPLLVDMMVKCGWESVHWSSVGDPKATDRSIMKWGLKNSYCVITNDLDFGDILAITDARGPSVIQFRTHDLSPAHIKPILLTVLEQYHKYLEPGALISVEETRSRVRILPLRRE